MAARAIMRALADLAPAGGERDFDVAAGGRSLVWLDEPDRAPRNTRIDRLAAMDALHRDERILRLGLAFVIGTADVDGARRKVRLPLLVQPVRLERRLTGYHVVPAGDFELTPLITDRALAAGLEAAPGLAGPGWLTAPGTRRGSRPPRTAAGLSTAEGGPPADRVARSTGDELVGVAAAALFVARDVRSAGCATRC